MREELDALREEIDAIDRDLTALFLRRMEVAEAVGRYKRSRQLPVLDPQREREVLERKTAQAPPQFRGEVAALFETLMALSRRCQRRLVAEENEDYRRYLAQKEAVRPPVRCPRVLYQGEPGAYAQEAAAAYFGETCRQDRAATWEAVFRAIQAGAADYGVVPIENSSTGSISQVYDLLARFGCFIVGEQVVKVDHCLAAPKGTSLEEVTAVYSHEQGFLQCQDYLSAHPDWVLRPQLNTALAARLVGEPGEKGRAAICSPHAAALYGLAVLAEHLNQNDHNYTRFVVVSPQPELSQGDNKVSALFALPHRAGTLQRVLSVFSAFDLNLVKLESRPIPERSWEYLFFADLEGNLLTPGMDQIIRELTLETAHFRVLGSYQAAEGAT